MKSKKITGLLPALLLAVSMNLWARELPRLAVVAFTPNTVNDKTTADTVTMRNLAESQMMASGKYQVIARADIDKALDEHHIAVSAISSAENVEKLKLMNISYIVTGNVEVIGTDYVVIVRILDVSNGMFTTYHDIMGSGSRELYTGINTLITRFNTEMSAGEDGAIVQETARPAAIAIEVSTKIGGVLYLQNEEIASLWDNDSYTIPIERPGTYTVKLVFADGKENRRSVSIASRGITKVDFYTIGGTGPAGGIVFYDKGDYSDGWCYLEAAPANSEFTAEWGAYQSDVRGTTGYIGRGKQNTQTIANYLDSESGRAAQHCIALNINGFTDWFLPSKDELDLMYKHLKQKGFGEFSNNWYWSSSQNDDYSAWGQNFEDGSQVDYYKDNTDSVRAIRAF